MAVDKLTKNTGYEQNIIKKRNEQEIQHAITKRTILEPLS